MAFLSSVLGLGANTDSAVYAEQQRAAANASTTTTTPGPAFDPYASSQLASSRGDNDDGFIETMSWQVTVLAFLASLSIFVNLSTCFVHLRFKGRRSNFSSVILAISALDIIFVASQLGLSIATLTETTGRGRTAPNSFEDLGICASGSMTCRLVILFPIIFLLLESSFLAVGGFNRWLAITKPEVPHWVKGRTCLISIMATSAFLTVAAGINVVRDDIILVRSSAIRTTTTTTTTTTPSPRMNNSAATSTISPDASPIIGDNFFLVSSLNTNGAKYNSSNEHLASANNEVVDLSYYRYGCSVIPSTTAIGVMAGIIVFYFVMLLISIVFLCVTWFRIWSVMPLPTPDGSRSLKKMVLRRKPEFVNSKFVDGYKIMWATLLVWIAFSSCALAVEFSPLTTSFSYLCLSRRFITTALLFLATVFKCFLYIGFSFTFRRAIFETFVAPCCSRFYRTQNYVVTRSSPFDRHLRIAVVGDQLPPGTYSNIRTIHRHHHHHHSPTKKLEELKARDSDNNKLSSANGASKIPAVQEPESSLGGDCGTLFSPIVRNYFLAPGLSDPSACFDISDFSDDFSVTRSAYVGSSNPSTSSNNERNMAFMNGGGLGVTAANFSVKSSNSKRISVVIDDVDGSSENSNKRQRRPTSDNCISRVRNASDNNSQRDDVSSSDVMVSSALPSPQPTSILEEENKV